MVDRFLMWVGAGVITAGLSAGMLAGAGLAVATEGSPSDNGGGTTSEPSNSPGNDDDSKESGSPDTPDGDDDAEDADDQEGADDSIDPDEDATDADEDATDDDASADEAIDTEGDSDEGAALDDDGKSGSHATETDVAAARVDHSNTRVAVDDETTADEKALVKGTEQEDVVEAVAPEVGATQRAVVTLEDTAEQITETPEATAVAFAAPAMAAIDATAAAPEIPGIIRVIGTIVFNLYAVATRLVGGPPSIPASSNVSVRSSTLVLECGCNNGDTIEVPADWYIPEVAPGADPPDRLIYLQHGFLASGPWYSHTAAALAEQTNSIVVAPSITSNFLAADACWLGAPPMHEAIAKLFDDGNTALADSAAGAEYFGQIPDRVVLMGHSLGGGAVSGVAGYMDIRETDDRLAGVVLLDGVGLDGTMAESLKLVDSDIPIYQLAAPKYFWNQFGVATDALLEARPDQFIGFTLTGGSHVDSMRGGNPLIQFSQQLVSGFSKPRNVEAARTLMVGWVNDMFDPDVDTDGVDDGIYADPTDPSAPVLIDTSAGVATAVPLPNSLEKPFILNPLQSFVSLGNGFFTFEPTCVAASMGTARCTDSIAA